MAAKKKSVVKETGVSLTIAQRYYLEKHRTKSPEELAVDTDLPIDVVNVELAKLKPVDHFDKPKKGVIAQNAKQSAIDDQRMAHRSLPPRMEECIHRT